MNVLARAGLDPNDRLRFYPFLLLIPASIAVGFVLAQSNSPLVLGAVLGIVPVLVLQTAFIRNLFLGIVAYLIVEYLQPGYRFPALGALRLALLVAASMLLAWTLNFMQHRVKLVLNWQVKSYIFFLAFGAATMFAAVSEGMVVQTVITMAKTLTIFFIVYSVVNTVEKLRNLIWTYVLLHLVLGILAFGIFFTTGERNFGDLGASFLGDENDSAMAILIMIPYAYFMLAETRHKALRALLIAGVLMSSLTVLMSFSRGAFLGFMTMVFYVWSKSTRKGAAAIVILIALTILFMAMPGEYWERIESVKNYSTEGSAQGRLDAWRGGINMMIDSPIFGVGLGNFNRAYGTGYNSISARWTAAHSLYVQFIGEMGVPGLIFIITTIFLTFRTYRTVRLACRGRSEPEFKTLFAIARAGECGFGTYLVATFFLNSMAHPHLWHFGAVAGCALLALKDLQQRLGEQPMELVPVKPSGRRATTDA